VESINLFKLQLLLSSTKCKVENNIKKPGTFSTNKKRIFLYVPTYIDSGTRWFENTDQPYKDDIHKVYIPFYVDIVF
jgi:hypothetical protein